MGGVWARLFESSMARDLSGIAHIDLGNPGFRMTLKLLGQIGFHSEDPEEMERFLSRMNSKDTQASEMLWRFDILLSATNILLLDTSLLDTAIGQYLLMQAKGLTLPAWGVGVDAKSSPLAAAYLRGILYPAGPDDLVKLVLSECGG